MTRISTLKSTVSLLVACGLVLGTFSLYAVRSTAAGEETRDRPDKRLGALKARVIATGIPGAGAVTEVGDFLTGSPLHDKSTFVPFTAAGGVLAPTRVLVASTSNFGAPLARPSDPEGTILSIDPNNDNLAVPTGFAGAGGQASDAGRSSAGLRGAEPGVPQQRRQPAGRDRRPAVGEPPHRHLAQQRQWPPVDRERAERQQR